MQSFSFIPLMASEKKIFNFFDFSKILPFGCHGSQSKSAIWTKFIWLVEYYPRNISVIFFFQNICSNTEINADFHISHCKFMEILSCHRNQST